MDVLWNELTFGMPDRRQFIQVLVRLTASILIAGIIGLQRESAGKSAGLRTHVLVSLGSTLFVIGAISAGMREDAISRVIQGIITGIGFIGAGTILKREKNVKGLTTSAGLWTTCAIGVVIGLGELGIAFLAAFLAFIVLTVLRRFEERIIDSAPNDQANE
ncbi:MAG: MgtC/SapB family protein [Pyrinomonadaceae bacterium]